MALAAGQRALIRSVAEVVVTLLALSVGVWIARKYDSPVKTEAGPMQAIPISSADKEMEQRLKWHWEAINKCRKEGGYAAMGFDDEVLCLRYPSLWWAFDGKGPP